MTESPWLPMLTTIAITPLRLDIDRKIRLDRRWPETYGFWWEKYKPKEEKYVKTNATPDIRITDAYWIDKSDNRIEYIAHDENIYLNIKAQNISNPTDVSVCIKFYSNSDLKEVISEKKLDALLTSDETKLNVTCDENSLFSKNKIIYAKATVDHNSTAKESGSLEIIHRAGGLIIRGEDSVSIQELIAQLPPKITNDLTYKSENFVFQMIRNTLSVNERNYLKTFKYNNNTHIDLYELILAKKNNIKSGGNYSALLNICIFEYSEIYISSKKICKDVYTNSLCDTAPFRFSKGYSFCHEKWLELNGNTDKSGSVNYKNTIYNFHQFSSQMIKEYSGDWVTEAGNYVSVGITHYPLEYQQKILRSDPDNEIDKYHWCSTNEYNQVIINTWMGQEEIVKVIGHEAYGHLMFKVIGKPNHSHTPIRTLGTPGCNDELEQHILDRQKESTNNFHLQN